MTTTGYEALRSGAAWLDLSERGKIKATGEDRVRLLHAMSTNNVQALSPGQGLYTFFLNAQGRVLADASVFGLPEMLLIDTEPIARAKLYEHIDKYIIADDVTLEDATEHMTTIGIDGPSADDILASAGVPVPTSEYGIVAWGDAFVARVADTAGPGYSIFAPVVRKTEIIEMLEHAGAMQASHEEAQIVRTENRRPRFGLDFGENLIAHETGLMEAVHFTKGCYLGQEIVERVRSRGHVNKRIYAIEMQAETAPGPGAKLQADGKDAGEVTSAVFSPALQRVVGFAIVRSEATTKEITIGAAAVTLPALATAPQVC